VALVVALPGFTVRRFLLRPLYVLRERFWPKIWTGRFGQRIFDDPMDVGVDLIEFVGDIPFLIEERLIRFFYFFSLLVR
jgi:hypothetical protein